ncbi:conserved hypothetical protein [Gloeothece citriformis PCC 7424]|uniref:Scytonemin biosynthesis protein n=1 Tax=Gloeothece citriformis (strain PCC 7424) TaxID=65393 RepID=B7KHK6_GLOC7|nr:scytonemin biosynthesis cyclase/decarboxylase ScyC [Gloeothece citriformis]ACK70701.1 conserved hypothetical protein [Gloeothece citriformis PCC 7424]
MEENTFATSAYIANSPETVYEYLCSLENLNEWTLYSRMLEKIDENTWLGTASGYQHNLYYHVKRIDNPFFKGIEWHCGIEYQKYFQVYPVFLFSPDYIEPGSDDSGVYFHWLSFVDPKRRTPMIMQGIETVHTSECRSLKATLEKKAGHTCAAKGRYKIDTNTMFVDAPLELGFEFLRDLRNMEDWAHLLQSNGAIGTEEGEFLDEYNQKVTVTLRTHELNNFYLIEQNYFYPEHNFMQRCPVVIIPCSYAFGDPQAQGFILHQITFWPVDHELKHGKLQMQDFGAESMNIKRLLEAKAGNPDSFARGMSYMPSNGKTPTVARV